MYHYLAYNLYRQMGNYASRTQFVELEINNEYQGVYVFMEKLKRDVNRINLSPISAADPSGGYILKIDKTSGGDLGRVEPVEFFETNWADDATYTEQISFRSNYDINGELIDFDPYGPPYHSEMPLETYFLYEYPKAEEITPEQKTYIQGYIDDFETALLTDDFGTEARTYTDFIDTDSFVDMFIINELCKNIDAYRLSTYLYKNLDGRLNIGPPWDFNIGFDTGGRIPNDGWVIDYNTYVESDPWMMPFWWPRLMEDPQFRAQVKTRWMELRGGVLSNSAMHAFIDETANYLIDNGGIERNYDKWDRGLNVDYQGSVNSLKTFMQDRANWMDSQINAF